LETPFPLTIDKSTSILNGFARGIFPLVFPLARIFCPTPPRSVSASTIVVSTAQLLRLFFRASIGSA